MWQHISTRSSLDALLTGWPPPVLDPAGPFAGSIALLSWVLLGMAAIVFCVVLAALWVALFGRTTLRQRLGGQAVIDFAPSPKGDRKRIEDALKSAFRKDGSETALAGWTPLGNFELQRKRDRAPLARLWTP